MALSEKTIFASVTIDGETGVMSIREDTVIYRDGTEISRKVHRRPLDPGADLSKEVAPVAAIANAVWTPKVLDAFAKRQAESRAEIEKMLADPAAILAP